MDYTDIGHDCGEYALWVWAPGSGFTYFNSGLEKPNHSDRWADAVFDTHWRGRFDWKSKKCSVAPPRNLLNLNIPIPENLISHLKDKFGDVDVYYFGPRNWDVVHA